MDPKLLSAIGAAGAAGGGAIGVEDVFKTYVYTGNSTARDITTNVDMSGGGMVWLKHRTGNVSHALYDTERGVNKRLRADTNNTEDTQANTLTAFNSDGFSLGTDPTTSAVNNSGADYVSYSFKKQKKFFTTITYVGNDANNRQIAHDLGSTPGCIIIKVNFNNVDWYVWHRGLNGGTNSEEYSLKLNTNDNQADNDGMGDTLPTSTHFTVHDNSQTNADGFTYVAYLFAHDEAEFGPNSDQKIISCGYYSGTGAAQEINVGFEPQWILHKAIDAGGNEHWYIFDSMRGITTGGNDTDNIVNAAGAESNSNDFIDITPTGFALKWHYDPFNGSGTNHIYIAIAAETGKTSKVPENGSDVFAMDTGSGSAGIPVWDSGFPVDLALYRKPAAADSWNLFTRLASPFQLKTNFAHAEGSDGGGTFDSNEGWYKNSMDSSRQSWMWKRNSGADCVTYLGNGGTAGGRQIAHSLGQKPQMIWIKHRGSANYNWAVYHEGLNGGTNPEQKYLTLNENYAEGTLSNLWNDMAPTSSHFIIGSNDMVNNGSQQFLALLFASVDSISHCGSYTGPDNGSYGANTITINIGFQPRFLLIKCTSHATNWIVLDSVRGFGSGNDKPLFLDQNWAQESHQDWGAFTSTGFEINGGFSAANDANRTYIYYAHA